MSTDTPAAASVLLVDDTPTNLEILIDYFADSGFDVSIATNGEKALKQIEANPPDLILLDVMMPGIDGFETCRRIKANQNTKDIPVIFMTALSETADKLKGFEAGAVDYVTKPLHQEEVLARVNTHLTLRRMQQQLEEKERQTERLLLNVLPKSIADKLRGNISTVAEYFPEISVLFADIVNFTELSFGQGPETLVGILDELFSSFDALVEKQGLEKIKTIGDAYMAVGGAPIPRTDHAQAIAELALGIRQAMLDYNEKHQTNYAIRIGMNSGPVVAGVIGTKKFSFDLWGDTVNMASRMESFGVPNQIQVTENTYTLLREQYTFEERGEIEIKGKGQTKTYFLKGPKV
jgi:class 3 adenylate cyclase